MGNYQFIFLLFFFGLSACTVATYPTSAYEAYYARTFYEYNHVYPYPYYGYPYYSGYGYPYYINRPVFWQHTAWSYGGYYRGGYYRGHGNRGHHYK